MRIHVLQREQRLAGTPEEVFPFFADARNLEAITPPLLRFGSSRPARSTMRAGTLIQYRLRLHGVAGHTGSRSIQEWDPPHRFVDVQVRGPYALWHHTHTFAADRRRRDAHDATPCATRSASGRSASSPHRALVRRDVEAIFDFRAQRVPALLRACGAGGASGGADGVEPVEDEVRRRAGRPGESARCDQATTPSGPTMTSARFVMPAGSK